uniref:Uncharacterized protein n=1 Tax=Avena sativa TaxID=4498 RepID=A0ACD6AJ68_AVESA
MPPRYSATTVSRIGRRLSSTTTSPARPSRSWSPDAAFAAAKERVRAGTLGPEDAHNLFDELLRQTAPVSERSLTGFLSALARAPDSDSRGDGPALAITLFNRVCREEAGLRVVAPTVYTYSILMDCCCRSRRPVLGLSFFGRLLRTGLKTDEYIASTLLKCLCYAKRTDEAPMHTKITIPYSEDFCNMVKSQNWPPNLLTCFHRIDPRNLHHGSTSETSCAHFIACMVSRTPP